MIDLRRRPCGLVAVFTLSVAAACATAGPERERSVDPARGSRVISPEEIAQSGARNAWEAIRSTTGLSLSESRAGRPLSASMRGQSSIHLDDTPVVVVDGMRLKDLSVLTSIEARAIASIEVTNGIQGTLRYGTGSGGGAIVVTTRDR